MASEQDRVTVPTELEEWLTRRAAETDHSKATLLARAVTSYRLLESVSEDPDALDDELASLSDRLETIESVDPERIEAIEADLDERFEELKARIIDVLKETRERAPADHDHPDIDERLESHTAVLSSLEAGHEELRADHESLEAAHEDLAGTVDEQLPQAIERLTSLSEAVDTLETRSDRLAGAVVDLRRRLSRVEGVVADRQALDSLLETAHEEGLSKATCESCRSGIELPLLRAPWCPHCSARFESIEPRGFLRRPELTVADRPALEAGESAAEHADVMPPTEAPDPPTEESDP